MPDIDDLFEGFLNSAVHHHIPEDVLEERASQEREMRILIVELDLVPVEPILGAELSEFIFDVWGNGC